MAFDAGSVVGTIILRYDEAVKALKAVQQQTQRSMGQMNKFVQDHQAQIRGLGLAMAGAGAGALLMTRSFLSAAGQMERYEAQFRVLTGSAKAAQERLKELVDFAAKTPFDLPGIIEADIMVQAMRLSLGSISETMTVFGDTAAAMNQPMIRVIATLAKLKAGMFETEQVAVNLGLVKEDFAALGVEFTKTGEVINRQALFPAAIKLIERFRGTMEETSKTLEGRLSNLRDSFFQLQVAIGEGLLPEGKDLIEQLTETIDTIGIWVRENPKLTQSIATMTAKVGLLATAIGGILLILPQLMAGIAAVVTILTGPAGIVIALTIAIASIWAMQKASEALADSMDKVARVRMLGPIAQTPEVLRAAEALEKLTAAQAALAAGPVYRGTTNMLRRAVDAARREYEDALKAAGKAVDDYTAKVAAVAPVTDNAGGATKEFKTRVDEAREAVKQLQKELSLLAKGTPAYVAATADLAEAQKVLHALLVAGVDAWAGYELALENVDAMWKRMIDTVITATDVYKRFYVDAIAPGMENISDLFEDLVNTTEDMWRRMEDGADAVDRAVREHLTKGIEDAIEVAQRLSLVFAGMMFGAPGVGITAQALGLESLPAAAEETATNIIDTYGTMWERIQAQWAEGLGRLVSSLNSFKDAVNAIAGMVKQALLEMISREMVEEIQQRITEAVQIRRQEEANAAFGQQLAGQQAATQLTGAMNAWTAAATALPGPLGQWVGASLQAVAAAGVEVKTAVSNATTAATNVGAATLAQAAAVTNAAAGTLMGTASAGMIAAAATMASAAAVMAGASFLIPGLQHGGIVTRPTVAMIGERGPEAVIPLTGPRAAFGAGVGPVYVTVSVDNLDDRGLRRLSQRLTDSLGDEISWYGRRMQ